MEDGYSLGRQNVIEIPQLGSLAGWGTPKPTSVGVGLPQKAGSV